MTTFTVDVVHTGTVKPSSPTPPHRSILKLSAIDQQEAPLYFREFLFYSPLSAGGDSAADRLKKSLSETLTLFYPFAGRIVENRYVHCNDCGISWFEARVNTQMTKFLVNPAAEDLARLSPKHVDLTAVMSVQVNVFDCSGIALAVCLTHQICDAASLAFFVTTWAATARGAANEIVHPKFLAASLFPPVEDHVPPPLPPLYFSGPKLTHQRVDFSASEIAALQLQCTEDDPSFRPSRVVAVASQLWRRLKDTAGKMSPALLFATNLRPLLNPPLPSSYSGNIVFAILATWTEGQPTLGGLANRIRSTMGKMKVRKLEEDYMKLLKSYDSYEEVISELPSEGGRGASFCSISSLCKIPIYDADFGWGKPEWVTMLNATNCLNAVIMMDTKCGTGVHAWILTQPDHPNLDLHLNTNRVMAKI